MARGGLGAGLSEAGEAPRWGLPFSGTPPPTSAPALLGPPPGLGAATAHPGGSLAAERPPGGPRPERGLAGLDGVSGMHVPAGRQPHVYLLGLASETSRVAPGLVLKAWLLPGGRCPPRAWEPVAAHGEPGRPLTCPV